MKAPGKSARELWNVRKFYLIGFLCVRKHVVWTVRFIPCPYPLDMNGIQEVVGSIPISSTIGYLKGLVTRRREAKPFLIIFSFIMNI